MRDVGFGESLTRDLTGHGMFGGSFQFRLSLLIVRALANRVPSHGHPGRGRPLGQSR
jgi:hypothetical protein